MRLGPAAACRNSIKNIGQGSELPCVSLVVTWLLPARSRSWSRHLPLAAHAESADEAAVRKAIDDLTKAMMAADKAKLEALVSDQLSYGHSSGKVETKAEFVGVIAGKKTIYKSITLTDPTVAVVGNNAVARHTFAAEVEAERQAEFAEDRRDAGLGEGRRHLEAAGAAGFPHRLIAGRQAPPSRCRARRGTRDPRRAWLRPWRWRIDGHRQ